VEKNTIYEIILSTYNQQNEPHAAPMGIILNDKNQIHLNFYEGATSCKNLESTKQGVINFSWDPCLFVDCTFFNDQLAPDIFQKAPRINAPFLKPCKGNYWTFIVKEKRIDKTNNKIRFICEIQSEKTIDLSPRVYTRAFSSLLEILIHSTRVIAFLEPNHPQSFQLPELRQLIVHHSSLIKRVTPENSLYRTLLSKTINHLQQIDMGYNYNEVY
jgi:hypothetical protein